ncbi:MAG: hypothetical protein GXP40_08255, partial [Chloroflexi bacterium]|nr:hypothetical protein [Chloroflexota bacterium]
MKTILLFDMDSVLLTPRGYHLALQETVARVGRLLGYRAAVLSEEDIASLEAAGVSSEWDSSAICTALLLDSLWEACPSFTLPTDLSAPPPRHRIPPPEFRPFIARLAEPGLRSLPPLARAERLLLEDAGVRSPAQRDAIRQILQNARRIERSLTHRVFQELVLGSKAFTQTYGLTPWLDVESYLLRHDRPTLTGPMRTKLLQWLQHPSHRAAIFTNRPNRPPEGLFGTPEAEIGAQTAGLEAIPIVGWGDMTWLGGRRDADPQTLIKPSSIHALAAMLRALDVQREEALVAAAALVLDGRTAPVWEGLRGAQVYAFEDTAAGLRSAAGAQEMLHSVGISLTVHLLGVAEAEQKRRALETVGAAVVV